MNIKSTSFLLLLLMAVLPAFSQVSAPFDNRYDGSVKDEQAHIDAKMKWIKENPEEYRKMGGDPEAVLGTNSVAKALPAPAALPPFKAIRTFKLVEVSAVPIPGSKGSAEELKAETKGLQEEFMSATTILHYGASDEICFRINGKSDIRGTQTRQGTRLTWHFSSPDCKSCAKNIYLEVVSETDQSLVVVMDSEDENAAFAYRFVFNSFNN